MIVEAYSTGPLAEEILAGGGSGKVIARFERSAYVAFGDCLVSIVHSELPEGALHVRAKRLPFAGDEVRVDDRSARRWRPPPWPQRIDPASIAEKLGAPSPIADPMELLGRGEGLTPEGDDVVIGMFLASHALGIEIDRAAILAAAENRTHAISLAHLRAAARGMASAPAHDALLALLDPAQRDIGPAITALENVGHSSGRCTLAGMRSVLAAWASERLQPGN